MGGDCSWLPLPLLPTVCVWGVVTAGPSAPSLPLLHHQQDPCRSPVVTVAGKGSRDQQRTKIIHPRRKGRARDKRVVAKGPPQPGNKRPVDQKMPKVGVKPGTSFHQTTKLSSGVWVG